MANFNNSSTEEYEVVISGMSGVFPESKNIDVFRDKLLAKENLITQRDDENYRLGSEDFINYLGQIDDLKKFDGNFFGFTRLLADATDPVQRITLEKMYEAALDAGINPMELQETETSVFASTMNNEYENILLLAKMERGLIGHCRSMFANRPSYALNVVGPSFTFLGTEITGFEAVNHAWQEIRMGRCKAAFVMASNMVFKPELSRHFQELGFLSTDGNCRSFDDEASGHARSEAIVVLFLQRAQDAKRVYASIIHSSLECHGQYSGKLAPSAESLEHVMKKCYDSTGIHPEDIDYLEAEGVGVKEKDEEEMKAVDNVILSKRKTPLLIGSVKSNMGHSYGASSLCSMVKVLIAMQKGVIPPNLHYNKPSSKIPALLENRAKVVTEPTPCDISIAAVNGFSCIVEYSAHLLLRAHDRHKPSNTHIDGLPRLVLLSSRTEDGLTKLMKSIEDMPVDVEFIRLLHDIHSLNIPRHLQRGYTIVPPLETPVNEVQYYDHVIKRPVWFIFSGMGSQWNTMGKELMKFPVCAAAIERCHEILAEEGVDLKYIITTEDPTVFDNILNCFVGIASIQIALVDLLKTIGIAPDGMVGHSVGELGCAYADGCLTLKEMILSSYYRGRASLEAETIVGSMAAIGLGYNTMKTMIPPEIDIACHNGADSCTLSGPSDLVKEYVRKLQKRNIFAKAVNVANIAYHSRYIAPAAPVLLNYLKKLLPNPKARSSRWISSSIPEEKWNEPLAQCCSAEYLTNNLLSSVLFEEACKYVPKDAITIEIAPHGLLQAILRRSFSADCTNIPLTQRGHKHPLYFLLSAIGKLYVAGLSPQVKELYPPVQLPVSRGTPSISPLIQWDHSEDYFALAENENLILTSGQQEILVSLKQGTFQDYTHNVIDGNVVFPVSAYLNIIWDVLVKLNETSATVNNVPVVFEDVKFFQHIKIGERDAMTVRTLVHRGNGKFEISTNEQGLVVTGTAYIPDEVEKCYSNQPSEITGGIELTGDDVYMELEQRGYNYKEHFKGITQLRISNKGSVASIKWKNKWVPFCEMIVQLIILHSGEKSQSLHLPLSIKKVVFNPLKHKADTEELVAVYNHATGIARCGALEVQGLKTTASASFNRNPIINMEALKFISYTNPELKRVEEFISLSVQWTIENSCSKKTVSIFVPTAVDIQSLVKYLAYNSQIILDVETLSQKFYNLVVVTRENDIQAAVSLMSDNGGFLLARIEGNSWHVNLNMIPVIRQKFGNEEYILFRKTEVKDGRHVPQVLHLNGKYSTWMQQIRGAAPCHRLLAIAKLEEQRLEAISFSVEQARKIPEFEHVRFIFLMGKLSSLNGNICNEQLQKDLLVNVLLNGQWGNFGLVSLESSSYSIMQDLTSVTRVEDTHVSYLGLNSSLLSESDSESLIEVSKYLNTLDFSGQSKSGQKQMGITAVHHEDKKVISDKLFTWQVPDSWSLQDAATVPVSYTIAYYSLAMAAKWKHGDTVLVTNGCSTIGQAALVLALDYGCTVFTTVADNEENKFIKQIFPQINDSHIFNYEDDSFELRLLKETEGNGVKIVLNCFSGDGFQSSVRCLADHGYLVHIGESKFLSIETCGMYIFLKNRAIFGVSIQNILNLPSESKEALHAGIQDRILRGVIKPLKYSVFNKQQSQLAFRSDADVNRREKVLISSVEDENEAIDLVHDPNSFFIVLGSDIMLNLDMAEWLARQGVRKVAVTLSSNKLPKLIERRVKLLLTYYNTQVIFFKTTAFNCNKSICLLVQNASEELSGPLEGIFVLPVEPVDQENGLTSSTVANLDIITRGISTLRYFVCLHMKNSWSICEQRYREGFPALSIFWDQLSQKHFDMKQTLYVLSRLVASKVRNPIIIATEKKLNTGESNRVIPSPRTFFPTTIQSITRLGEDLVSNSEWLQELPSLSPGYRNIKTISPVFIIPGLQGSASEILKPLLQQLVHPVFCARILQPEKTITDAATILVKQMKEKQNSGRFNIIGVSWGGILAIEVARLLEAEGHTTNVILIDGAPDIILAFASPLNVDDNLDISLISILRTELADDSTNIGNWEKLLSKVPEEFKSRVSAAQSYFKNCIQMVADYKPSGKLVKGNICLMRPSGAREDDNCLLDQFFKQTVKVHITEGDHLSIISNSTIGKKISEFFI